MEINDAECDKRKGKYLREVFNDFGSSMIGVDVGFMNIFIYFLFGPYLIYRLLKDKTIPCILSCFVFLLIMYSTSTYSTDTISPKF